ncbi:MAG TPA: methyltransferase, partial [Candidatus Syntrophoarchaeum butanivorans]|nr:methyltransferase [Candidatus Syntrophoarchaeum butanivorans]
MKSKGRGDIFSMVEENLPPECRIAIGMSDPRIIQELTEVERFADLLIVSGAEIESDAGFEIMISDEPERELVDLLMRGEVDGAVRGTLPASKTLLYLRKVSGIDNLARVALLKPKDADPFLFAPVGIDEGDGFDARLRLIENGIWMLESLGLDVRVGILSGGRIGDMGRSPRVDESLREGDLLIGAVADMGYQAVHHEILIEDAVRDSNLIIAP